VANETCPQKLKKVIRNYKSLWKGMRKKWAKPAVLQKQEGEKTAQQAKPAKPKWDATRQSFIVRHKTTRRKRSKTV